MVLALDFDAASPQKSIKTMHLNRFYRKRFCFWACLRCLPFAENTKRRKFKGTDGLTRLLSNRLHFKERHGT
jgi:hypothetical protein